MQDTRADIPKDGIRGLIENGKTDFLAGFVIFLIALPLSLGIAMASGVPPMAGLISAAVGGLLVSMISGSYVTINGPAAGLIVIILDGVEALGGGNPMLGYQTILACIVISGAILTIAGLLKAGKLGDVFPLSAVHGMLSAIGVIIISKQIHTMLGVTPTAKSPFGLLAEIPHSIFSMNPEIATIGIVCLTIMILLPKLPGPIFKVLPVPLVAVIAGMVMATLFDLDHQHLYLFPEGHAYEVGPKFLVSLPENVLDGIVHPKWGPISTLLFWKVAITLALVQGLETLLSTAAVDKLDRYQRVSNLSRDLSAVGIGTMVSGWVGGLPMIAEIVRSSANISNGAKTRWSNFFHGLFVVLFVVFARNAIHHIPLAALAAILVVTGFRLASPSQFSHALEIGRDQLIIFVTTLVTTLATDLIIGVASGICVKILFHWMRGAGVKDLFAPKVEIQRLSADSVEIHWHGVVAFTNFLKLRSTLEGLRDVKYARLNLSRSGLVDHTAQERLENLRHQLARSGLIVEWVGLDDKVAEGPHRLSARRSFFKKSA